MGMEKLVLMTERIWRSYSGGNYGFQRAVKLQITWFSVYSFASVGNDMIRNYESIYDDANRLTYALDRWTGEGTSNFVPR
jgi:hypothetical protein